MSQVFDYSNFEEISLIFIIYVNLRLLDFHPLTSVPVKKCKCQPQCHPRIARTRAASGKKKKTPVTRAKGHGMQCQYNNSSHKLIHNICVYVHGDDPMVHTTKGFRTIIFNIVKRTLPHLRSI